MVYTEIYFRQGSRQLEDLTANPASFIARSRVEFNLKLSMDPLSMHPVEIEAIEHDPIGFVNLVFERDIKTRLNPESPCRNCNRMTISDIQGINASHGRGSPDIQHTLRVQGVQVECREACLHAMAEEAARKIIQKTAGFGHFQAADVKSKGQIIEMVAEELVAAEDQERLPMYVNDPLSMPEPQRYMVDLYGNRVIENEKAQLFAKLIDPTDMENMERFFNQPQPVKCSAPLTKAATVW